MRIVRTTPPFGHRGLGSISLKSNRQIRSGDSVIQGHHVSMAMDRALRPGNNRLLGQRPPTMNTPASPESAAGPNPMDPPPVAAACPAGAPSAPPSAAEQHEEKENSTPAPSSDSVAKENPLQIAPETVVAPSPHESDAQPTLAMRKQEEVTVSPVLGAIEAITPAELAELLACEEVVGRGCNSVMPRPVPGGV